MSFLSTANLPLLSVPAYYVLALYPHIHAMRGAAKGEMGVIDIRNPNGSGNKDNLRKRLTAQEYAAWERGESCHRNALENMPLFVSAIFAGLLAQARAGGADAAGVKTFTIGWMALRTLYTVNYLITERRQWALLRSVSWMVSTGWAFTVLVKAAFTLGA